MAAMKGLFYLAGPMSGIADWNRPRFREVAEYLRDRGWEILSPEEADRDEGYLENREWSYYLARDLVIVSDKVDGVIAMEGWEHSKGARQEMFTAMNCGKRVFEFYANEVWPLSQDHCLALIQTGWSHGVTFDEKGYRT